MTEFLHRLRAASIARQKEWDTGGNVTLSYRGNELGGECGEAQNIIKKLERERFGMVGSRATPAQLAEELADIVICVDLIAQGFDLDLVEAIAAKFNGTSQKYGLTTRV
jgi:NTP pyrophosphatase (non-canonical NTP hydrolase)